MVAPGSNVRILTLLFYEDSPEKNTALKMVRYGLAIPVKAKRDVRGTPIVLNPFSDEYLGPWHKPIALQHGILVVDASWRKIRVDYFKNIRGIHVKLPPLLPGNPVNYGKPCMLSSIEAVAGALYILGFKEQYHRLLHLFKWMNTFHTLNEELLEAYSKVCNVNEMVNVIRDYWEVEDPCFKELSEQ